MSVTHRPAINIKACDVCGINDSDKPRLFDQGGSCIVTEFRNYPGRPCAADVRTIDLCETCRVLMQNAINRVMKKCKGIEIEPGVHSGCDAKTTGATDCPECGDSKP